MDTPNILGPVAISDPRNPTHQYFSTSSFGADTLGVEGNASRRFFHGPGINNWDMALLKNTQLTERINLQFRAELFNVFNHAQFENPSGLASFNCPLNTATNPPPPKSAEWVAHKLTALSALLTPHCQVASASFP